MMRETKNEKDQWGRGFIILFLLVSFVVGGWSLGFAAAPDYPTRPVLCIAPSKPGSGFDTTIRAVTATLAKEKLVPVALPVENASSSVSGMATIVLRHKNNPYMISVKSIAGMLNFASGMSPYSHKDWTPIARLISAYYGIMVRYDSPYKTLGDLVKDLKANIGKVPFSGGTSDDRIAYGAVFSKAGIDITKINYAAFAGGTEASGVVLEGSAKVLISSIDDVMGLLEAKRLRMLGREFREETGGCLIKRCTHRAGIGGGCGMGKFSVHSWRPQYAGLCREILAGYSGENGKDPHLAGNEDPIPLGRYFHDRWAGGIFGRSPGGRHRHCEPTRHGKEEIRHGG